MKYLSALLLLFVLTAGYSVNGQQKNFYIFTYKEPDGFSFKKLNTALFYQKKIKRITASFSYIRLPVPPGSVTSDFEAKWTGSAGGGLQYYNAYTGSYAGMSAI